MPLSLLVLLHFTPLVQGTPANVTVIDSVCLPPDGTFRSVWSILGSCALTLLICVWHTIHFDLPQKPSLWTRKPVGLVLMSFFAPEIVVAVAATEWLSAWKIVNEFHRDGYEWSMTHSFFAEMGGFVYCNSEGRSSQIYAREFLTHCKENKILNPKLTVKDIRDKSKSDSIGKAILMLQLLWFMLQVVVRGWEGLAVTLVELDTVCMAVLSLLVICLWWDKPLRAECPHTFFYSPPGVELYPRTKAVLSKAWKPEPGHLSLLIIRFKQLKTWLVRGDEKKSDEETGDTKTGDVATGNEETAAGEDKPSTISRMVDNVDDIFLGALSVTWAILGGLHLIAWNFLFPTVAEKMAWRVASLILAGGPPVFVAILYVLSYIFTPDWADAILFFAIGTGVLSRALLVALMLASLRALPCTAHQTVAWTTYIPHL